MELQFLTPTLVWEGFHPKKDPLETSTVFSTEKDNIVSTGTFFTSETCPDGKLRPFIKVCYDKRWIDPRPAVLVLSSPSHLENSDHLIADFISTGCVVCILDFNGSFKGDYSTVFPDSLANSQYPECNNHLDRIEGSAKNSPWFHWAKIARRAITFLEDHPLIDSDRIGVLGIGKGAQVAWQVAGMDSRVASLVAVNGGGYLWRSGAHRFTMGNVPTNDEERAFSTGVGAETYARLVSCPTCYVVASNNRYADVDRAEALISLVPGDAKTLMISRGTDEQITSNVYQSLKKWLKRNLTHDTEPVPIPSLSFNEIDGILYLVLSGDRPFSEQQIAISYGEPDVTQRFWTTLEDGQKTGENEYAYKVPVYNAEELITAFASVSIDNVVELSCSPVIGTIPSKIGVKANTAPVGDDRIIYTGNMGLGRFSLESDGLILDDTNLSCEVGPFNIKGISVKKGKLVMYRSPREQFSSQRDAMLLFDAYSATQKDVLFSLHVDDEKYTATISLNGGECWQKISLSTADFKNQYGKHPALFADGKKFSFEQCENVLFNNILWL